MTVNRFDIWLASVKFKEIPGRKNRPAIIWKVKGDTYVAISVTTHAPRKNDAGDYQFSCHSEAGISKSSVARCAHMVELYDNDLMEFKGKLQQVDICGISATLYALNFRRRQQQFFSKNIFFLKIKTPR